MTRTEAQPRRAGILVPLFSVPSSRSWGIGEIGDIAPLARWLESAGQRFVQLLPINELPPHERSPYSALSAMAIDPQFITMAAVEDVDAIGGEEALERDLRHRLDTVRSSPFVNYEAVRSLKSTVLRRAFVHFRDREWRSGTRRASAFRTYMEAEGWWLDDYALYRALKASHEERAWVDWPEPLRTRQPAALEGASAALKAGDFALARRELVVHGVFERAAVGIAVVHHSHVPRYWAMGPQMIGTRMGRA